MSFVSASKDVLNSTFHMEPMIERLHMLSAVVKKLDSEDAFDVDAWLKGFRGKATYKVLEAKEKELGLALNDRPTALQAAIPTIQRSIEAVFVAGALITTEKFSEGLRLYKDLAFKYYLLEKSAEQMKQLAAHEKDHAVAMLKQTILDANRHGERADSLELKVRKLEGMVRDAEHEAAASKRKASQIEDELEIIMAKLDTIVADKGAKTEGAKKKKCRPLNPIASIERSLEKLQIIADGANQPPVSAEESPSASKSNEALEAECNALKAANAKLQDDFICGQKDRQRDKEEMERLREQLQKLRAEKEGSGVGKKKKGK